MGYLVTVRDFLFRLPTQTKPPNLDPGKRRQNHKSKSHEPNFCFYDFVDRRFVQIPRKRHLAFYYRPRKIQIPQSLRLGNLYFAQSMGFEPTTPAVTGRCSNQLSYDCILYMYLPKEVLIFYHEYSFIQVNALCSTFF